MLNHLLAFMIYCPTLKNRKKTKLQLHVECTCSLLRNALIDNQAKDILFWGIFITKNSLAHDTRTPQYKVCHCGTMHFEQNLSTRLLQCTCSVHILHIDMRKKIPAVHLFVIAQSDLIVSY